MKDKQAEMLRRQLLQSAAGLAVGQLVLNSSDVLAATGVKTGEASSAQVTSTPKPPGKAGDFDFLAGSWNISHRRLKTDGSKTWDEFKGEATCWSILSGIGSIEELRIPERNFSGMGLRLLDVENKIWSDFWVNARSGVLTTPGTTGYFENGAGIFLADDVDSGRPIKVRGMWDRITAKSCRWRQSISRDGGKTWDDNWLMEWSRV